MKYEKPQVTVRQFSTGSFLEEDDMSAPFVDESNLDDVMYEALDKILNP